jgi:2-haloacid dehalogenase
VLRALKAAGVRCYALSNMEPGAFAIRQQRFAFMSWFDGYVVSGLEGVSKPDRRIFDILLQRYRLEPGGCVLIDDSPPNIQAARELGMIGLHFTSARQLRADLGDLGVRLGRGQKPQKR